MQPVLTISERCPNCRTRCRWTVPVNGTEIRSHVCRRGTEFQQRYVIKISGREATVRGQRAAVHVLTWNPVE